jgi:hypothetical protein
LHHVYTQKKKKSGSISIQILTKIGRKNKLLKTVGCAKTYREEELLVMPANTEMERLSGASSLFTEPDDLVVESFENSIANDVSAPLTPCQQVDSYPQTVAADF